MILLYIDPGSGSYLIQLIIAGIVGALVYFKDKIAWIKSLFNSHKKKADEESKP